MKTRMPAAAWGLVVACCFGYLMAFVSTNVHSRFNHRAEIASNHLRILEGLPCLFDGKPVSLPVHNRVLMPLAMKALSRAGASDTQAYLAVRIASGVAAGAAFYLLLLIALPGRFAVPLAVAATGALVLSACTAFGHPWEQMEDFPDLAFFGLAALLCTSDRLPRWLPAPAMVALVLVAGTNRESSVFFGWIWICTRGVSDDLKPRARGIAFGLALMALAWIEVHLLRRFVSAGPDVAGQLLQHTRNIKLVARFLNNPRPFAWPFMTVAMMAAPLLACWLSRAALPRIHRRLLFAAAAIAAGSILLGSISELRIHYPTLALLVWSAAHGIARLAPDGDGSA